MDDKALTFLVEKESWGDCRITQVAYANRTPKMLTGTTKVRDIVGHSYYVPSKLDIGRTHDRLCNALKECREHVESHVTKLNKRLAEIEGLEPK